MKEMNQSIIPYTSNSNANDYESEVSSADTYSNNSRLPKPAAMVAQFRDNYSGKLIWNTTSKSWFEYQDELGIWVELNSESIQSLIQTELDANPLTQFNYGSAYISDILNLLKNPLRVSEWNAKPNLLPLQNGVLDLQTKELLDHSPDYRFCWCLPYNYDPKATCEPIQEWLLEMMQGDEKIVQLLRAYMNAVIKGRSDLQRFLECVGEGGTGKSTFANLVIALIGISNTHPTSLKTLETDRFENANLLGKRLVYIADSERYTRNVSKLKALTGQDQLRYEKKYTQGGSSFRFDGMVLIVANETIQFNDFTSGIQRRRITIPFNNRVRAENRRNLIEVFSTGISGEFAPYLSGLLNWVLEMSDDEVTELLKNTELSVPSLAMAAAETLIETNPMAAWLDEYVVIDSNAKTNVGSKKQPSSTHLYPNYVSFCESSGYKPVATNLFSSRLVDLVCSQLKIDGVEKKHTRSGNCIVGLRLRTDGDTAPRPISDVMGNPILGDGSQDAETLIYKGFEGCDELDDHSSSSYDFAMEF
mgnify:CR=1 FL=1